MTTPAPPQDPGAVPFPAAGVFRTPTTFEAPLGQWGGLVRTGILALRALLVPGGLLGAGGRLEQSYVKATAGIPGADLDPAILRGLLYRVLWNGTAYVVAGTSTVVTAANRPTGTYRSFAGPADPDALGIMIDGDDWRDSTA